MIRKKKAVTIDKEGWVKEERDIDVETELREEEILMEVDENGNEHYPGLEKDDEDERIKELIRKVLREEDLI